MGETSALMGLIILTILGFIFTTMSIVYLIKKPSINILANVFRGILTIVLAILTMYALSGLQNEITRYDHLKENKEVTIK